MATENTNWIAIKMKGRDLRRWEFVTPKGGTTNLRIHAAIIESEAKAQEFIAHFAADPENAGYEFKVVTF